MKLYNSDSTQCSLNSTHAHTNTLGTFECITENEPLCKIAKTFITFILQTLVPERTAFSSKENSCCLEILDST